MTIPAGRRGFVTNEGVREPYIILHKDTEGTRGYFVYSYPDPSYHAGFDNWFRPEDLAAYFSGLIVEWEDGGANPPVARKLELCVVEPPSFSSPDGENFLWCNCDLYNRTGQNEDGDYVLVDCTPFQSDGVMVESLRITAGEVADSDVLIKRLNGGDTLIVNGTWLENGVKWTQELAQSASNELNGALGGSIVCLALLHPPIVPGMNP
jgi:hypothetical protein